MLKNLHFQKWVLVLSRIFLYNLFSIRHPSVLYFIRTSTEWLFQTFLHIIFQLRFLCFTSAILISKHLKLNLIGHNLKIWYWKNKNLLKNVFDKKKRLKSKHSFIYYILHLYFLQILDFFKSIKSYKSLLWNKKKHKHIYKTF